MQKDVLFGLSQGTKVLQTIHKEMGGLEAVEKLMGDTEEARAYQEVRFISYVSVVLPLVILYCFLNVTVHSCAHTPWISTGGQPHAGWPNVQPRRGRGRR